MEPETRYAKSGTLNIAYSTSGDGPIDVMMVPGFISHVEYAWREPSLARFLRRLSTFLRVIMFDKRGMGLSDRLPTGVTPTLEERIEDIRAVLDAAGSTRAILFAWSEGGPLSMKFAATHADRVAALVLVGTTPRFPSSSDFPAGIPQEILDLAIESGRRNGEQAWRSSSMALRSPTTLVSGRGGRRTSALRQRPAP
jgi:pimeloyl-ACP methyl ester carboxylesterase